MSDVSITVIAKLKPGEVFDELAASNLNPVCDGVKLGESSVSRNLQMPEGFCSWAWTDIQSMVSCCTDGLRPVVFRLERID